MATVRDEFASIGGSDGTSPPGENNTGSANAVFDNPHYQRHYATAPPIVWPATPTTSASARTTFTGIDPSLLTRPPPPPPPRTQTQIPSTQPSGVYSKPAMVSSSRSSHSGQRFHPYSGVPNSTSMPAATTSHSGQFSASGAQHARGAGSNVQDHWQEIPLPGFHSGSSAGFLATGSNAASSSSSGNGHGFGSRHGQIQSSSSTGAQPSFVFPSTDHGLQHGQSHSQPSATPHPLQHLVDIHNAGPVSAFSRDPSTFTGKYFIQCIPLTFFRGASSERGLCLWARGSVECELPPSRGWLPPVFFRSPQSLDFFGGHRRRARGPRCRRRRRSLWNEKGLDFI